LIPSDLSIRPSPSASAGVLDFLDLRDPTPKTDSARWGRDWLGLGRDIALIFSFMIDHPVD